VITVDPVTADAEAPVANAGADQSIVAGDKTVLDASSSTDNVGIVNYTWTFTYDGVSRTLYGQLAAFKFDAEGDYTITLTTRDAAGNALIIVLLILVIILALLLMMGKKKEPEAIEAIPPPPESAPETTEQIMPEETGESEIEEEV
jgi:hypothetical protein